MSGKGWDSRISVRVAIVLTRDGEILLARHEKRGRSYWVLPGGRLQYGETVEECGRREMKEEAGVDIRVGSLLYVSDRTSSTVQEVCLYFRGYLDGGRPERGSDPEAPGDGILKELAFVTSDEFRGMEVLPPEVKEAVLEDWASDFRAPGRFIGTGCDPR